MIDKLPLAQAKIALTIRSWPIKSCASDFPVPSILPSSVPSTPMLSLCVTTVSRYHRPGM